MKQITNIQEVRSLRKSLAGHLKLGFVPTMGALHEGHVSLINESVRANDRTILSIFVNPTQFNNPKDLQSYPSTIEKDLEIARDAKADFVFLPSYSDLYKDKFEYQIHETKLSKELCGAGRPGHFTGVLTVVMKLLNLVAPDRAYFGLKDFQQYELVKGMCEAFFLNVEICAMETIRDARGLAISSRNRLLDYESKKLASHFNKALYLDETDEAVSNILKELGFSVNYVETRKGRRFGSVTISSNKNEVRLIDNVNLEGPRQ